MKSSLLIIFFTFLFVSTINAQTVDSIKVEQAGELIKIHYKILNSTQYQTFNVAVSAKINGGLESKLESLIGDVGDAVKGGKDNYIVIWDVLKDVDEVNSVDFSVRAELLMDNNPDKNLKTVSNTKERTSKWEKARFYIIPGGGEGWGVHLGVRIGYMGSWGVSARYMIGTQDDGDLPQPESYYHMSIDLTKRVISKNGFQAHIMAGVANGKVYGTANGTSYWETGISVIEAGVILGIGRVTISYAITPFPGNDGPFNLREKNFSNWGVGVRF
jgi:hypothetical protein